MKNTTLKTKKQRLNLNSESPSNPDERTLLERLNQPDDYSFSNPQKDEIGDLSTGLEKESLSSSPSPLTAKDIGALRLQSSDASQLVIVDPDVVAIKKASEHKMSFCRTTQDPEMWGNWLVIEDEEDKAHYLVVPELGQQLTNERLLSERILVPSITNDRKLFLWPLKVVEGKYGCRDHTAHSSHRAAAERAKDVWIRVSYNFEKQRYCWIEQPNLEAPQWPSDLDYLEMIQCAFEGRIIESLDHELIQRLGSTLQQHG